MDEFLKSIDGIQDALDENEQKRLLLEYYNTKNEDIRKFLLVHNQKLCVKTAIEQANKYHLPHLVGDLYSVCNLALAKALDNYNPFNSQGAQFSTYATQSMIRHIKKFFDNEYKHYLRQEVPTAKTRQNTTEQTPFTLEQFINSIIDDSESDVANDIAKAEKIKIILSYFSEKYKEIIKMRYGIDYPKAYTEEEIAKVVGVTRQRICQIINREFEKVRQSVAQNHKDLYPGLSQQYRDLQQSKAQISTLDEKYKFITYSYYGIHGFEKKSSKELAVIFGTTSNNITKIKDKYLSSLTPSERKDILDSAKPETFVCDQKAINMFNDFFGINNRAFLSLTQLQKKYRILGDSTTPVSYILEKTADALVQNGTYTQQQMDEIRQSRQTRINLERLNSYAPLYFSYKGENGYSRKTQDELASANKLTQGGVGIMIQKYKAYLDSLSPADRQAEILRHQVNIKERQ